MKTRSGVRVSGVENQDASRWRLSVELNQKRQVSTVTAYSLRHNSSVVDVDRWGVTCHHSHLYEQWRRQDLVPGGAHAKINGFLQEAAVDI